MFNIGQIFDKVMTKILLQLFNNCVVSGILNNNESDTTVNCDYAH